MTDKITLYVISQTHWDREWYQTFQGYRYRLVRTIDDLIDLLERDKDYKYFHMDGQTIPLLDYLQIRPKNRGRLEKLIKDGRIIIGPWYVMPDEFLISGEALVRNLQLGLQVCQEFGADYLKNGYVVDIFGHNGQMPQILKGFNIHSATLFRGIADYPKDLFTWEGVDGSRILTFKLCPDRCYSNWYFSIRWPYDSTGYNDDEDLIKRAGELIERSKVMAASKALLMMDGVDHIDADPELPRIIRLLNERFPEINVVHSTLEQYEEAVKAEDPELETIKGPLYNIGNKGLNNAVVRNVLSSMVHIKQMNDKSESLLTGWAEPLNSGTYLIKDLVSPDSSVRYGSPRSDYMRESWKHVIENQPHDSICGCSVTEVHQDNEYRFRQAIQIAEQMTDDAMYEIAHNVDTSETGNDMSFVFFNTTPGATEGVIQAEIDLPVGAYRNFRLYDEEGNEVPYQILEVSGPWNKHVAPLRKVINFETRETIKIAASLKIPGYGYSTYTVRTFNPAGPGAGEYRCSSEPDKTRYLGTMRSARNVWDNGVLVMSIAENGTLTITNKKTGRVYTNVLSFEDTGDIGEGWNWRKPEQDSEYLSVCGAADVSVENDGPFSVTIKISRRMMIPQGVKGEKRSEEKNLLEIISKVTLLKNSNRLDIQTELDNKNDNHRLRVLLPTGFKSDVFYSQTPFDMQKWNVKKDDWSTYRETETYVNPSQGVTFMEDGRDSVEIYSKGLYEVEVTETDRTMALTLFRSFSSEVGRFTADWGLMHRKMKFEYAFVFGSAGSPDSALRNGLKWKLGIKSYRTTKHAGKLPRSMTFAEINSSCCTVSAINTVTGATDEDDRLIIRLYNPTDRADKGTIVLPAGIKEACYVDLKNDYSGNAEFHGKTVRFEADPRKIVSLSIKI